MREIDGVDPDYIASSAAGRLTTPINEPRRCAMSASAIQTRPAQLHELGRYLFESWKHDQIGSCFQVRVPYSQDDGARNQGSGAIFSP